MQGKQEQGHAESAATLQMVPLKLGYDWFLERVKDRCDRNSSASRSDALVSSACVRGCVGTCLLAACVSACMVGNPFSFSLSSPGSQRCIPSAPVSPLLAIHTFWSVGFRPFLPCTFVCPLHLFPLPTHPPPSPQRVP